jgi:hypothetical protein
MIDKKFSNNRKQNNQRRGAGSGAGTEGGKADADWRLELRRMWWGKRSLENACLKATVCIFLQMCLRVPPELQQCGFFASLICRCRWVWRSYWIGVGLVRKTRLDRWKEVIWIVKVREVFRFVTYGADVMRWIMNLSPLHTHMNAP